MTTSAPVVVDGRMSRQTARKRRRTRFLVTAEPTAFVTMKPNLLGRSLVSSTCRTRWVEPTRRPRRMVARKSPALVTRFALASTERLRGQFDAALATTSGQDGTPRAGTHAKPESVHFGATAVVRLESSLTHGGISKAQLSRPEEVVSPRAGSQLIKSTVFLGSGQTLTRLISHYPQTSNWGW